MNHKTDMQAVLLDAMRVIAESADEIKAGCAIDDEWPDAENKAEYDRRVSVLERVRALAGQSAGVSAEPKRGTDAQILFERRLTCEAINGAIAFGYQNTSRPPSDDHWLAPFWKIGRKQAGLEAVLGGPSSSETIHQVWVEKTSSWADVTPAYYSERLPSNRRKVYYKPTFASQSAGVPEGWKLVPIEPTVEMKIAGDNAAFWCGEKWKVMLGAAPAPVSAPSPDREQVGEACIRPATSHCQNGGDVCLAGNNDGVCCPEDSCDIDDGVRKASVSSDDLDRLLIALGLEPRAYRRSDGHLLVGEILSALAKKHAADASPSYERAQQDCPHGVDDGACKQCYGEATSGKQGASLSEGAIIAAVQKACGEYRTGASYDFEDVWNCIEAAFSLAASAPTLGEAIYQHDQGDGFWKDVPYAEWQLLGAKWRRIVYTAHAVAQPQAAEQKQPPFGNCQFRICDLPGQCRAEGKCHHPVAQAAEPKGLIGAIEALQCPETYSCSNPELFARGWEVGRGAALDVARALLTNGE